MAKQNKPIEIYIKCKEPGCPLKIPYTPEVSLGLLTVGKPQKTKIVYLTCDNNHMHPYSV